MSHPVGSSARGAARRGAAVVAGDLQRQVHRRVDRDGAADSKPRISRLRSPSPAPVSSASSGVEQAAVGGVQARLGDLAHRPGGGEEVVELDPAGGLELGPRPHPHPGLGDHAEDPLGADQHPVRRGPGAGARQPPALPGPARRDRPHRLDQVVDVGVERSRSARRPGSRSSRPGSRTRRTAGSGAGSARARAAAPPAPARSPRPGSAPPATSGSTSSTRSSRRRSSETTGRSPSRASTPPTTLVPPPNGITAAPSASAQLSTASISDSSRGKATRSGGFSNSPAEPPHHVPVGLAQRVRDPLVVARRGTDRRTPLGAFSRGSRSSTSSSGTGFSTSPPNPNRSRIPAAASRSCVAVGAWSSYPHPQCLSLASHQLARRRLVTRSDRRIPNRRDQLPERSAGTAPPGPTSARLSSGARRQPPRSRAPCPRASSPFPFAACESGKSL